jgi:mannose-1-phosphate guanylyltransferase
MVLCAGFGSRLRPLTDELAKPLLPIGDRSLLDHALRALATSGLEGPVVVNVFHLAHQFLDRKADFAADIEIVEEPSLRGTAGGIAGARHRLGPPPVVILNADVLLSQVPSDFVFSAASGELVLAVAPRPAGMGSVGLGHSGHVVRLRGERFGEELQGGEYVGLLALGAAALAELPESGCLIGDFALPQLRRGARVLSYVFRGSFAFPCDDLGGYFAENLNWLAREKLSNFIGIGAQIESKVELRTALVGAGAHVSGSGALERVLVLPNASCQAPLRDAIVTPNGSIITI